MKRILATIMYVATVAIATAAASSDLKTDTTGDGKVTTVDVELICAYILGTADEL